MTKQCDRLGRKHEKKHCFFIFFFFYQQQTTNPEILQPKQNSLQTPNFLLNHSNTWVKGLVPGSVWKFCLLRLIFQQFERRQQVCELPSVVIFNYCWCFESGYLCYTEEKADVSAVRAQTHCGHGWWMKPPSVFRCSFSFQQHERKLNSGSIVHKGKTQILGSHFWSLGDVCSYSKDRSLDKTVSHLNMKRAGRYQHCQLTASFPSGELDSCGREWNNNKGRILLAYLVWCEICLWAHQKILRKTDKARAYQHINSVNYPLMDFTQLKKSREASNFLRFEV